MPGPHLLRGYHATSREDADAILAKGFEAKKQPYHWLGQGIYFYQDALRFTLQWARVDRRGGPIDDLVVIGADLLYDEWLLDLADYHWGPILTDAYNELEANPNPKYVKRRDQQRPFRSNRHRPLGHWLDCYVIDEAVRSLGRTGIVISAVRGVFGEGRALYPKAHQFDRGHIQIAVRNTSIIKDFWEEPLDL